MPTAVLVEAAVPGRRAAGMAAHPLEIEVSAGPVRLRQVIEAVVRAEVAAFAERARMRSLLTLLTEQSLVEGLAGGAVRHGESEATADVDADVAVEAALEGFEDGVFKVLVDDDPIDDLETVVMLRRDSWLLFLRLVALAGG